MPLPHSRRDQFSTRVWRRDSSRSLLSVFASVSIFCTQVERFFRDCGCDIRRVSLFVSCQVSECYFYNPIVSGLVYDSLSGSLSF